MSFLNKKDFSKKPCKIKSIILVALFLLAVGGVYTFSADSAKQKNSSIDSATESLEAKINSSGLSKNKKVKNVEDVEEVIAKWVESNPQAILTSVANMQQKVMADQMKEAQKNIGAKKAELFEDKNDPQYAPSNYDVSVVEFFDYSCGYCKKAQATVEELLKTDQKVRIIYKELPILGSASEEMATVALAVNIIDKSAYKKFHDAMMKSGQRGKEAAIKVAKSVGVNGARLESVLKSDKEKIAAIIQTNRSLGASIGINGTPGFIIGEELIPGAFDLSAFKEKIAAAREKK